MSAGLWCNADQSACRCLSSNRRGSTCGANLRRSAGWLANRSSRNERRLERETGIEPATNSLEGCDSTTELLPPMRSLTSLTRASAGKPARATAVTAEPLRRPRRRSFTNCRWLASRNRLGVPRQRHASVRRRLVAREGLEPSKPLGRQIYSLLRLTASLPRRCSVCGNVCFRSYLRPWSHLGRWSWRRDLNPRPADYKSAALPN